MITADRHHQWPVVSALFTVKPSDAQLIQLWNKCHTPKLGIITIPMQTLLQNILGWMCLLCLKLLCFLWLCTQKSVVWCPSATDGKGERKEHCTDYPRKIQLCTETTHQLQHRHGHRHNQIHQVSRNSEQNTFHSTFQDSTKLHNNLRTNKSNPHDHCKKSHKIGIMITITT